ncbi:BTB/POZ domain-containing protein KCTD21-like [Carcharodon carcharias]|uniref:BTB/POZ domain-containing protein KCTD21-like n=1 Tax=Carcharodon carcharias TaxID=13397 RepID=UPI001B7F429B|nr:BTB/POZ domain-containing protein KCTD21-like [Carcharodon carcharias]
MSDPVSLNVGGTLYTTSSETLTRYPDSMLGAMFKGRLGSRRDQSGNLFIDRDGKPFRHILNYLRSSHLDLPEAYRELRLLKREADFYQIGPLMEELGAQQRDQGYALLQCNILSQTQTLHFNQKQGPLNYALATCSLTVYRARLFSTCSGFLALLSDRLGLPWPPEPGPAGPAANPCRLELAWSPRPPELPEGEYARLGLGGLGAPAGQRELGDAPAFVEELLQAALGQRYRVDSLLPDPGDILNCTALRFLRY